jgi:hypothetical protein
VNLNAGGGSERLALTTLEALRELGYIVDIVTFSYPQWDKIIDTYGLLQIDENVGHIEVLDDIKHSWRSVTILQPFGIFGQ